MTDPIDIAVWWLKMISTTIADAETAAFAGEKYEHESFLALARLQCRWAVEGIQDAEDKL